MTSLRSFRRFASLAVLTAWMTASVGAILAPHSEGFDIACGDAALTSSTTVIAEAGETRDGSGHCDLCHLQRLVRGSLAGAERALVVVETSAEAAVPQAAFVSSANPLQLPSRAPPSPLL